MDNSGSASLILCNGKIISQDKEGNIHQAVAVCDDIIIKAGLNEEILTLKDDKTLIINLQGKTVVPGLIDSHVHCSWAGLSELEGELFIPQSIEALLDYIKLKVTALKEGEWLYFRNTYPTRLDEYRFPTLDELDMVAPCNPVYIDGFYAGQANSCALKLAGITKDIKPSAGKICIDKNTGRPSGLMFMCGYLIKKHIPVPSYNFDQYVKALSILQKEYNSLGITSVIDGNTSLTDIEAFNHLFNKGRLTIRPVYTLLGDCIDGLNEKIKRYKDAVYTPEKWGKLSFLKVLLDGGILTGTACMRNPYPVDCPVFGIDEDNFHGIINYSSQELQEYILKAYENNLQMTAHCIGDLATDTLLSAYESVHLTHPIEEKRFSIIHADFTDKRTLERIKDLNITLISQPAWHYKDGSILNKIFDKEVMETFLPYRDIEEMGIAAAGGSDHMVKLDSMLSQNPYNPYVGMYTLVTRMTCRGETVFPEQKISREAALKIYTMGSSYASFDETNKGSLEPGKLADMAVISADYLTCPEDEIPKLHSLITIVGGKIVYARYGYPISMEAEQYAL